MSAAEGESGSQLTRILIADEHEAVRAALRGMLTTRSNWQIVAEAADGKEAILKSFETKPDIAVLDAQLPLVGAVEVTRRIRGRRRRPEVLILAIDDSVPHMNELLKAGARGYLNALDAEDLVEALEFSRSP